MFRYSAFDILLVGLVVGYLAVIATLVACFDQLPWYLLLLAGLFLPVLDLTAQNGQHYHAHTPFFVLGAANHAYDLILSALYGYPQKLYTFRHMWHHRHTYAYASIAELVGLRPQWWRAPARLLLDPFGVYWIYRLACLRVPTFAKILSPWARVIARDERTDLFYSKLAKEPTALQTVFAAEAGAVVAFRFALAIYNPMFFVLFYVPFYYWADIVHGYQEFCEHYGAMTGDRLRDSVSCYNRCYNLLYFNNGYHQEHHIRPGTHWTRVPGVRNRMAPERSRRVVPGLHWTNPFI